MSDKNSNEKKNMPEREHRDGGNTGSGENRRNQKNNNYRKYHQRRPYPRNGERNPVAGGEEKTAVQGGADVKHENTATVNESSHPKKNGTAHLKNFSENGKDFRRNQRQGGFDKRKNYVRVDETIQDIDIDIGRIEKEIELEIKEIAAFKFGL